MGVTASPRGVRTLVLPRASRRAVENALRQAGGARLEARGEPLGQEVLRNAKKQVTEFLSGKRSRLDCPLDLSGGTPFQRRVWKAIRAIPPGQVRSYKWVARRVGGARYARAVGLALGANPLPLVVPCHRVVGADGSLGGFTGGLRLKRRLLALEGALTQLSKKR